MNIDHIAVWANDIELLKDFYVKYLYATANARYHNPVRGLTSYFLTFPDGGPKLEIMNEPCIIGRDNSAKMRGFCHMAIAVGSKENVDAFTEKMRSDGVPVLGNPRYTGDGLYESVIADPEGNIVEITI